MGNKKVEVVMPVFDRRELTLQCLRSLSRIDRTGIDLHVIVVDTGSTDGTAAAIAEAFPDVELIPGTKDMWYTAGTNRGIVAALEHDPDHILCCNDDSILDENCMRYMVECAERYPHSVVGPLLLDWEMPHRIFQVAPKWETWGGGFRHWQKQTVWTVPKRPWAVELIVGNCVLYPAEAIREAGLMDEKHLIQYGDAEYTPRMRRQGWRLLIEPRARVFCKPNDPSPRIRHMSFKKKLGALFTHSGNPHSLHRRFYMTMGGAPNRISGIVALAAFFARVLVGRSFESSWALSRREQPLTEVYAESVVEETSTSQMIQSKTIP